MLPVKKILCPIDFSEPSYESLKVASELAAHFGAQLLLVHVIPEIPLPTWADDMKDREAYEPGLSDYEEELYASAQREIHDLIKQRLPAEIESIAIVGKGDAACEIAKTAESEHAGLIVISTHGMTGWRQITFGSVAERIVRLSNRPVLTIRSSRS
jgi:nucleotide-binding universal stress UspA family protein